MSTAGEFSVYQGSLLTGHEEIATCRTCLIAIHKPLCVETAIGEPLEILYCRECRKQER